MVMETAQQTEQALIGAILLSPEKMIITSEIVRPEDFTDVRARQCYLTALGLFQQGRPVDPISLANVDPKLAGYVGESMSKGLPFACKEYAQTISISAKKARILAELGNISKECVKVPEKLDRLLNLYQQEMFISRKNPEISQVIKRFSEHVRENKKRGAMGIPTGFGFLENKYIQYVPGHTWTIAGFTSVGKTAVMIQKICNILSMDRDVPIVLVSTEMTEEQVLSRILSNFTGVHSFRILSGNYWEGEEEQVDRYRGLIKEKKFKIYDDVYEKSEIETVFRKANLQGGVDIGFVDYVQNCTVQGAKGEYESNCLLAKGIQKLAKDVRATIICLSQVSNSVGRGDTDQLEMKGAGEWAAVSDVSVMLKRNPNDKYQLKYLVKKNRHGALLGHIMEYKSDFTRIEPLKPAEG
jgi:replicative DNA helicase